MRRGIQYNSRISVQNNVDKITLICLIVNINQQMPYA